MIYMETISPSGEQAAAPETDLQLAAEVTRANPSAVSSDFTDFNQTLWQALRITIRNW